MILGISSILLLLAALPGLLARRVYYSGEFHRQFSAKNIILSLLYSIIIGVPLLWVAVLVYNGVVIDFAQSWKPVTSQMITGKIQMLLSNDPRRFDLISLLFDLSFVWKLLILGLTVFLLSVLIAYIALHIVRAFELDILIPFLRFENHWYYYLRGEFLKFRDFNVRFRKIVDVYADVLLKMNDGPPRLYSGFLKQYTLKKEANELDLIYLTRVSRWNEDKVQKEVPTSCFIIPYRDVLNINLRVVYEPDHRHPWRARLKTLEPVIFFFALFLPFLWQDGLFSKLPVLPMVQLILGLFFCSILYLLKMLIFSDNQDRRKQLFRTFLGVSLVLTILYGLVVGVYFSWQKFG